jgi:PAS domain S-box-containing protein
MTTRRIAAFFMIVSLAVFLGLLGRNVWVQLRGLSVAETDNMQWTILQLETEIANLQVALSQATLDTTRDVAWVRLRADIALSRLSPIVNGNTRDLFTGDPEGEAVLAAVNAFADDAIAVLDAPGDLTRNDLVALRDLTEAIRPSVRQLALLGLEQGTVRSEARRAEFARLLRWTGGTAFALIIGLVLLLGALDRVLAQTRRHDAALRVSRERLSSTVEASLDAIVAADTAGRVVQFNAAAERIFGWPRDQILGRKMDETIIPHQHRAAHVAGMDRYLETREPHVVGAGRVELTGLRRTGEEFPIELSITSVVNEDGDVFIAFLRDISQRKITEQKLIDARDRAENMDRAKSQFLAVMSHEMRTPLNGVLGVLDLLRTTGLNDQQERYVGVAAASGEILLEHVNEALDITRIEVGAMALTPVPFALKPMVRDVVDVLAPLAHEKGVSLEMAFDPAMDLHFKADGGRIGQIVTNLIGNAIKFTETGHILVTVSGIHGADVTSASVTVTDTGRGIPADHHEDIFEDFVALAPAHAQGRQSRSDGLGLSIARKIARLMGGDLTVKSTLGAGSAFTLNIPLERIKTPTEPEDAPPLLSAPTRAKSVLIVEDNSINRSVLRDMLTGLGHEVSEAKDGLEGLHAAQAEGFDLIVMDISMPVMDGIEAARRIRQDQGPNQSTPILGLTAHGREEYRTRAELAGMTAFCTKPIRLAALRDILSDFDSPTQGAEARVDATVLDDLIDALGFDRARDALDRFGAEFHACLDRLTALPLADLPQDMGADLHKLRGGAAILGLTGVIDGVDDVAQSLKDDDSDHIAAATERLRQAGQTAQADARARIDAVRSGA